MRKHHVTFFSPGTFMCEQSSYEIASWDPKTAVGMAEKVLERYNAKPFGFQFTTIVTSDPVPDGEGGLLEVTPKEVDRSGMHYLGGKLRFLHEIDPKGDERILHSNMDCNDMPIVIENRNSWRYTGDFSESSCIVDPDGKVIRKGSDADLLEYRRKHKEEKAKRYQ